MPMIEVRHLWTLGTSTGQSTDVIALDNVQDHTWHCQTDGDSTASLEIRVSRTTTGPWATIGSSQALSTGELVTLSFTGPYLYAAPRLIAINSTANRVFIDLVGV